LDPVEYTFQPGSITLDLLPQDDDRDPPSIWEKIWPSSRDYWSKEIPGGLDGYKVTFKDPFTMNLDSLYYFLTKNVFALETPGQSAVKIDTEFGLQTPHDVMLVGHMV
jgi:hypothetical protein